MVILNSRDSFTEKKSKAKKTLNCEECLGEINKDETYYKYHLNINNELYQSGMCQDCYNIWYELKSHNIVIIPGQILSYIFEKKEPYYLMKMYNTCKKRNSKLDSKSLKKLKV